MGSLDNKLLETREPAAQAKGERPRGRLCLLALGLRRGLAGFALTLLLLSGCQQKMARQPSYRPLQRSSFFADGRASRSPVVGTVAQGAEPFDDPLLYAGKDEQRKNLVGAIALFGAQGSLGVATLLASGPLDYSRVFPFPVTQEVLERGRERYSIYCVVCHDPTGNGNGKIVQRGYTKPPSYITDLSRGLQRRGYHVLLRDAPVGYYFEVITKGYGAMADYSMQVPPHDRWAIIAYIRALQLSQHAPLDTLPAEEQQAARKALEVKP